jgi:hypothetical protein
VFQARLKLLCEKALLLAPLLGLVSLHGQQVIVTLDDLTVPAGLGDSSLENSLLL